MRGMNAHTIFPITTHFIAVLPADAPLWGLMAGDALLCQSQDGWGADAMYLTTDGELCRMAMHPDGVTITWPSGDHFITGCREASNMVAARVKRHLRSQHRADYIDHLTEEAFCGGMARMTDGELDRFIARLVDAGIVGVPAVLAGSGVK